MPSTPSSPGLASCPQLPPNPDGSPAVWSQACGGSAARFSCFSGSVFSAAVRMWQLQRLSVTVSILRVGVSLAKPCAQSPQAEIRCLQVCPRAHGPLPSSSQVSAEFSARTDVLLPCWQCQGGRGNQSTLRSQARGPSKAAAQFPRQDELVRCHPLTGAIPPHPDASPTHRGG